MFLLVLSILTLESVHSIRFLYHHFSSGITTKSLNTFYHACSYAKVDYSHFMNITAKVALRMFKKSSRIWILSAMPGLILSCMILLLHIPAAEDVPPNMGRDFLLKQIFLFNPFSIEIFKSVLENIIDSYYEAQRELLIICYYPSDEYLMCLSQEYNVTFVHEIDCSDVSDGEAEREKIVVYRVEEGE